MPAKEIRFHGRGGQGAVLAARMLASACAAEGRYVASFPMYGFERRGMPVVAFTRFDDEPIREKTQIYTPDCLVVIDPTLLGLKNLFEGLKPDGILVLNSPREITEPPHPSVTRAAVINATQVALCEIGRDIPNTCLIGALAKATRWVKLESVLKGLAEHLEGDMLKRNIRNAERGYEEVQVMAW
jgi:2-oxoacid:acceptor oxidoreductase gamma subunit (pyruvate/2-ketoisovalerate family)